MKKLIYVFLLFFSFISFASAENPPLPVDNYTNPQNMGGGVPVPQSSGGGGNGNDIAQSVSEVTQNGMSELDKVINGLTEGIDSNIKDKIQKYYQQITAPLIPVFAGFIVIWVAFQGISMMTGRLLDINQILHTFIILVLIWTIVFSWDSFYPYVAEVFLDDLPNLISEMTGTDAKTTLQSFITIVFEAISLAFANIDTGITNVVSGFFFVIIYSLIFGLACIVCAMFFLIWVICKVIIGILIVIAPIFLACAMFPATRRYATNWLQAVLTPLVVILLLIVSCDLVLSVVVEQIQDLNSTGSTFTGAFIMVIVLLIVMGLFYLVPKIAISLVGNGFEASTSSTTSVTQSVVQKLKGK